MGLDSPSIQNGGTKLRLLLALSLGTDESGVSFGDLLGRIEYIPELEYYDRGSLLGHFHAVQMITTRKRASSSSLNRQ